MCLRRDWTMCLRGDWTMCSKFVNHAKLNNQHEWDKYMII